MTQIVNATIDIPLQVQQMEIIRDVADDLLVIQKSIPQIAEIVVRGGFFADIYYSKTPSDIDLFYSLKGKDRSICYCDEIRNVIDTLNLRVIKKLYLYDLENSYEKEPMLQPIERSVGFFSYHTDWLSMFCINPQSEIWTNTRSLELLRNGVHEIRYEGFIPWAFYPKSTDANNYFLLLAYEIVRGLAHIKRRGLKPGPHFVEHMSRWDFLVAKVKEYQLYDKLDRYAKSKCGSMEEVNQLIKIYGH